MTYLPYVDKRKNTIAQWSPSDSEKNYREVQKNGKANYSLSDVNYKYNSAGFRCDEFTTPSDLSILFMGCSFTEGIGLPLSESWANRFLTEVNLANCNKRIPFFSLALAGAGFDTMARELYNHCNNIKPQYIIYLSSSVYRREVWYQEETPKVWLPTDARNDAKSPLVRVLIDSQYAINQTTRSLMLIDSIAQKFNTKVIVMQLRNSTEEKCNIDQASVDYSAFSNITEISIPIDLYDTFPQHATLFPGKPDNARDSWHPGVCWQHEILLQAKKIVSTHWPELGVKQ